MSNEVINCEWAKYTLELTLRQVFFDFQLPDFADGDVPKIEPVTH